MLLFAACASQDFNKSAWERKNVEVDGSLFQNGLSEKVVENDVGRGLYQLSQMSEENENENVICAFCRKKGSLRLSSNGDIFLLPGKW